MTLFEAYDAILALGAAPGQAARVAQMRGAFEERTGQFAPEDAWFEARSRAFWDDAVTTQSFAQEFAQEVGGAVRGDARERELPAAAQVWIPRFARAHRGLFVAVGSAGRREPVVRDLWGGAELIVHEIDDATRDALAVAAAPFDARLVGSDDPARVGMLPGAVFHPADAAGAITAVLEKARQEARRGSDVLDALLRMERGLRASARVKPAYAYRADRLGPLVK
jgi:hypothetical protein